MKTARFKTKTFRVILLTILSAAMGIALAVDSDSDGMSDLYETFFELNPNNRVDASENYDSDQLDNLQESGMWTDPFAGDTDGDGIPDDIDRYPLSRAVMYWGSSEFTSSNRYNYPGPEWFVGALKDPEGGVWEPNCWYVPASTNSTWVDILLNRSALVDDLMMETWIEGTDKTRISLDLYDDENRVARNVGESIRVDRETSPQRTCYLIPLSQYPDATRIRIRRKGAEDFRMYRACLFIDNDADGLDAEQELQMGTSDQNPDSDGNGYTDFLEMQPNLCRAEGFDLDGDGMSDVYERFFGLNLCDRMDAAQNHDNDRLDNFKESCMWSDPFSDDMDGDGFPDHADSNALSRAAIFLDSSEFTEGNLYYYPGPDWFVGALVNLKDGIYGNNSWYLTEDTNTACWVDILLDRTKLSDDVVMELHIESTDKSQIAVDLRDDRRRLAHNVDQIIKTDRKKTPQRIYSLIPLSQYPDATRIRIRRLAGEDFKVCYTSLYVDNDVDGLDADQELQLGTSDQNSDSDGDGLSDLDEVQFDRSLVERYLTWPEARREAELRGGHLVTVTSEEEHLRVLDLWDGPLQRPWIGATDEANEGNWTWVTGESFDFNKWSGDSPNNYSQYGEEQNYASYGFGDVWLDEEDGKYRMYIIEHECRLDPTNPDSDGDGLLDGQEIVAGSSPLSADSDGDTINDFEEVLGNLNPCRADSDRDGLSDADETDRGLNPLNPDMDGDGLKDGEEVNITMTDPLSADSDGNGIGDLALESTLRGVETVDYLAIHISSQWSTAGDYVVLNNLNNFLTSVDYYIDAKTAGMHQLAIAAHMENFEMKDTQEPRIELFIDGYYCDRLDWNTSAGLPAFTGITPWLSVGNHRITLRVCSPILRDSALVIERVELQAIDGIDTDGDGIQDWMGAGLASGLDTDGDGLSDEDEVRVYGTDPLSADSDFDGLADADELAAGTDPLDADSDNDGILDGVEVHEALTNPMNPEFDGIVQVVDTVSGSQTNNAVGSWIVEDSELKSGSVRGSVEYTMNFPTNDLCRLSINASHVWSKSSCAPVLPKDTSAFLIYVDGVYVGKFPLVCADGVYVDIGAFLPVMPAGEHTIKLYWENVHRRLAVKINRLELQSLGGPDSNGNGVKDWVEASLSAMSGVDSITESYVSPACIEGDARYVPFVDITGGASSPMPVAHQSAGPRWYANLPLDQDGITAATASFQNGGLAVPVNIEWTALNIMEHDGDTISIRKDDRIKVCAFPLGLPQAFRLDIGGRTLSSADGTPIILQLTAGSYTITGLHRVRGGAASATVQIEVVEGTFPSESPACLMGREREWSFVGMPSNVVFEVDNTVELSVLGTSSTTNNNLSTIVSLKASDTNGDHVMLARLYPGGPILTSMKLSPFWIQNAVDGYFWTVERYDDSELWEVRSVAKNVPDSVDIQITVIVAGVLLDDYTLERWITDSAYNEIGEYNFRLFHPNESESSTCHTFKMYQKEEFIGEAL